MRRADAASSETEAAGAPPAEPDPAAEEKDPPAPVVMAFDDLLPADLQAAFEGWA